MTPGVHRERELIGSSSVVKFTFSLHGDHRELSGGTPVAGSPPGASAHRELTWSSPSAFREFSRSSPEAYGELIVR